MNKIALGAAAGLTLVGMVAAASPLNSPGGTPTAAPPTLNAAATAPIAVAAASAVASATATRTTPAKATPSKVVKVVRQVKLTFPKDTKVGGNATGFISVNDVAGTAATPVAGATVALQQKRGTSAYVEVSEGVTDETGRFPVSFTSRANTNWRAVLKTTKPLFSTVVLTTASAQVNWAGRPDMEIPRGTSGTYKFRVTPSAGAWGQLQVASTAKPSVWSSVKPGKAGADGVITQSIKFNKPGTYLVRGASVATATNASGYTTAIEITVV